MFITYNVSVDLIRQLRDVVAAIKRYDRDLADQLQRAASSVALNLSEGQRLTAGNQRKHYESAHGSANEVRARSTSPKRGAGSPRRRPPATPSVGSSHCCGV